MRNDAIQLEEGRLKDVHDISDYYSLHERHRIFPMIFEDRSHKRILDIAAGVGIVGRRIKDNYPAELLCNDISPTCLKTMKKNGIMTTSFDIDNDAKAFPFSNNHFDAVIGLAVIEHLIHVDHFLKETHRIIRDEGCLYLSAPNYSGLPYLIPFLLSGKTFHDPMVEPSRYEFYAHVRYFTYQTLIDLVSSFGFVPDTAYLALPEGSSRFLEIKAKSWIKSFAIRNAMKVIYNFMSPRWASEPVICFRKTSQQKNAKIKKLVV